MHIKIQNATIIFYHTIVKENIDYDLNYIWFISTWEDLFIAMFVSFLTKVIKTNKQW